MRLKTLVHQGSFKSCIETYIAGRNGLLCYALWFLFLYLLLITNFFSSQNVRFHVKSWLPARSIVAECLEARKDIHPSGEIMALNIFCPVSIKCLSFHWLR